MSQNGHRKEAVITGSTRPDSGPSTDQIPEADAAEQQLPADGGYTTGTPSARFVEAAEADLAEQQRPLVDHDEDAIRASFEADPPDAVDQYRSVPIDDEDYR